MFYFNFDIREQAPPSVGIAVGAATGVLATMYGYPIVAVVGFILCFASLYAWYTK